MNIPKLIEEKLGNPFKLSGPEIALGVIFCIVVCVVLFSIIAYTNQCNHDGLGKSIIVYAVVIPLSILLIIRLVQFFIMMRGSSKDISVYS